MKIGISDFAKERHKPGSGHSYFIASWDNLVEVIRANWFQRKPGAGRTDLSQVVLVPIPGAFVVGTTATLRDDMILEAKVTRRQPHEDPYVSVTAVGQFLPRNKEGEDGVGPVHPDPVQHAYVVLYSAETLLENDGKRSGDYDWECVAIVASAVEDEPIPPLTLARNFLQKPGGTFAPYTAEEFARSIYYWSTKVKVKS